MWKVEVLARLKEPQCWVCAHAINEVHRDFFWFITAEATREAMRVTSLRQKQAENAKRSELRRLEQKAAEIAELEKALSRYAGLA